MTRTCASDMTVTRSDIITRRLPVNELMVVTQPVVDVWLNVGDVVDKLSVPLVSSVPTLTVRLLLWWRFIIEPGAVRLPDDGDAQVNVTYKAVTQVAPWRPDVTLHQATFDILAQPR